MAPPVGLASSACILSVLLASAALAQLDTLSNNPQPGQEFYTLYKTTPGTGVLLVTVFGENARVPLDRQAVLKLQNLTRQTVTWQTTEGKSQAVFTNVVFGSYDIAVNAVGYLSAHKELQVMNQLSPTELEIVLKRDPAAINLDVAGAMPAKARKEAKRAVSALKSGNLQEAQKRLDLAYKLVPSSPDLNFLLGYLYFQKKTSPKRGVTWELRPS